MKRSVNRLSGRLAHLSALSLHLQEDAEVKTVHESGKMLESKSADGTRPVQIITPGWGSSGYYSQAVLEKAAEDKVIPAGTHMYLNHATYTEQAERPERDVEKIAAVLTEDAVWNGVGLVSTAKLIGPHAELIESLAPYIGVSIDGDATDITIGEAEGRRGRIIEGLAHVSSVDFVTHAGRGGALLLESARPSRVNALATGHGVKEATVNEIREQLQEQLRELLGGEKSWVWVRDFDDKTVWFEHETEESYGTYALDYSESDGTVTVAGTPVEVRASTTYVPVARPDDAPITESREGTVEIDDKELEELRAKAGRADVLEAEKAAADLRAKADAAITEAATEAKVSFTVLERRGLLADLPLKDGQLDTDAFKATVTEAAKDAEAITESTTVDPLKGFGESATVTESAPANRTHNAWGRPLAESSKG